MPHARGPRQRVTVDEVWISWRSPGDLAAQINTDSRHCREWRDTAKEREEENSNKKAHGIVLQCNEFPSDAATITGDLTSWAGDVDLPALCFFFFLFSFASGCHFIAFVHIIRDLFIAS